MTEIASGLMAAAGAGIILALTFAAELPGGSSRGLLLVANKGDHSVSIVDPEAGREIGRLAESGVTGHEIAASPDGRTAWVPIYGDSGVGQPGSDGETLDVFDLASRRRIDTIRFPQPVRPHCAVFGPDGMLYVSNELTDSIAVIDPHARKIVGNLPTGQPESHMLTIARDGKYAFTSNVHAGTVSVIDLRTKKVSAVIPVSKEAQRISLSADGHHVFTADQASPRLAVIDTATNTLKTWVPLPGIAYGTCATPDGRRLVLALIRMNKIGVIDLQSLKLERTIDVPKAPQEVLVRPGGRMAYISCDASHKVVALNLETWNIDRMIDVGPGADGLAWSPSGSATSGKGFTPPGR